MSAKSRLKAGLKTKWLKMLEVILTCRTDEGSQEIVLKEGKVSFGRGSEADYRFGDDGLSRLHATVYREGDNVWILD